MLRGNSETEVDVASAQPAHSPDHLAASARLASKTALEHAQACLEAMLAESEDWRALKQLEAREANGEWFDVIESDVLRDRLTLTMAAAPEFIAWQFVDAAIGCLDAGAPLSAAPARDATHDTPTAATAVLHIDETPIAQKPTRTAPPLLAAPPDTQTLGRELTQRIPTLLAHERRTTPHRGPVPPAIDAAQRALERALLSSVNATTAPAPSEDALPTRFAVAASSVAEADVQIVPRGAAAALSDMRLPPLPLTERAPKPGMRLPRVRRVAALKWAEPAEGEDADYRPIGSALDEAQVSIIDTATQSEALARAARA